MEQKIKVFKQKMWHEKLNLRNKKVEQKKKAVQTNYVELEAEPPRKKGGTRNKGVQTESVELEAEPPK